MVFRATRGGLALFLSTCAAFTSSSQVEILAAEPTVPLPQTSPLTDSGDFASQIVDAADRFLLREIEQTTARRDARWREALKTAHAYSDVMAIQREVLSDKLGMSDPRLPLSELSLVVGTSGPARAARGSAYDIFHVSWPAFGQVTGTGLLLEPRDVSANANVVAIPHCDTTPEQLCGISEGLPAEAQYARRLAESGCRVVVPALIDRAMHPSQITHREWLHRSAYELGRTMTGYETSKCLSVIDWFASLDEQAQPIGVFGWGDGGRLALFTAALDPRIDAVCVSGGFGASQQLWHQPADRMVFGLLNDFGDAQLAAMIAPRTMIVEAGTTPTVQRLEADQGRGAPYEIVEPTTAAVDRAARAARELAKNSGEDNWLTVVQSKTPGSASALRPWLTALQSSATLAPLGTEPPEPTSRTVDPASRQAGQIAELDRHNQALLRNAIWTRKQQFWDQLDTSSLEAYRQSIEPFREHFYDDVIGRFPQSLEPAAPRTRLIDETDAWRRYEVVLDVMGELFAYGILTVPTDIGADERRPAVVCQHGLEGRPQDLVSEDGATAYQFLATRLADRGFVTFAPQNLYIFKDRFRTLQRKGNSIGKTLFSLITPQHQQIVDWLKQQPFVDPDRIAFYGLSYGGKTAMRVPPLVADYCLSICSADFNEWVDKNASTHNPRSYVNTGEYEIFEWNLGHTFNYAEMAALIAPRPFMVERGHFDGVADDWTVGWEYARVRHLYAALLKIPDRTAIEWFDGPHAINGQGTFDFLHRHLNFPKRPSAPTPITSKENP